jgi:uncharacterized protein with GYD domain
MPMCVGLYKLTAKGAAEIKKAPERLQKAIKTWEAMGGTTTVGLATIGRYDYISVGAAPSDEVAAMFAPALGSQGFVATETLRGFTPDECASLLAKLP